MEIARINGFLEALAVLNNGPDHRCSYELTELPAGGAPEERIAACLAQRRAEEGMGPGTWEVRLSPVDDPEAELRRIVQYYFFALLHSPRVRDEENVVACFQDLLNEEFDYSPWRLSRVDVHSPDTFYASLWDDYLITLPGRRLFWHLGVSD